MENGEFTGYHLAVSENRCTPKSSIFNRVFHYIHLYTIHFGVPPFTETPIWNFQLLDAAQTPKLQSMPFEGLKSDCQVPPGKNAKNRGAFRRDVYGGYKLTAFKSGKSIKINQDSVVKSSGEIR